MTKVSISFLSVARLIVLAALPACAMAQGTGRLPIECASMAVSDWGVLDYRTIDRARLQLVERFHFTPEIEQLKSHRSASDLSYTLRRFQNHHRALMSMMNLGLREKSQQPQGAEHPVHCYMQRAEVLFPDDAIVKMLHGLYLLRTGRPGDAVAKLEAARELKVADANLHYNLGLAYVKLKRYDDALASAHRAYALGFPLPGLRNQLQRAGRWRDPD